MVTYTTKGETLMRKYTFTRSAIVQETYCVEAETEQEAYDIIRESPDQPVVDSEFLDWYTDDFVCEDGDTPLTPIQ